MRKTVLQTYERLRDIATVERMYKKVMKALINTLKPSGYYVLSTLTWIELCTSLIADTWGLYDSGNRQ
jgi:hypothetical protein